MGKAGDIGDVVELRGGYYFNLSGVTSYSDDATGEGADKSFERKFRYSKDGVTFSDWIDLTNAELQSLSFSQGELFYVEYSYKRTGSDASGVLEVTEVTLSTSTYSYPSRRAYEDTFMSRIVEWHDQGAIDWSFNVMRKMLRGGAVPEFVRKESEGSFTLWRSVSEFFGWMINYFRKVVDPSYDITTVREFLDSKGYFWSGEQTVSTLRGVRDDYVSRVAKRGSRSGKDAELKNIIGWSDPDEYEFEISLSHRVGWNINNSSPLYAGFENDQPFMKTYEKSLDVLDIGNYPIRNAAYVSKFTYDGKETILVDNTPMGEVAGIDPEAMFDSQKAARIDPSVRYQVSAILSVSGTCPVTFGVWLFDENETQVDAYEANTAQATTKNEFFSTFQMQEFNVWYGARGILFEEGYSPPGHVPGGGIGTNLAGTHLEIHPDARYAMPFVVVDNSGGGSAAFDLRIHSLHLSPLSTEKRSSFLGMSNLMRARLKNSSGELTDRGVELIVDDHLKPYNYHVFYDWI